MESVDGDCPGGKERGAKWYLSYGTVQAGRCKGGVGGCLDSFLMFEVRRVRGGLI